MVDSGADRGTGAAPRGERSLGGEVFAGTAGCRSDLGRNPPLPPLRKGGTFGDAPQRSSSSRRGWLGTNTPPALGDPGSELPLAALGRRELLRRVGGGFGGACIACPRARAG